MGVKRSVALLAAMVMSAAPAHAVDVIPGDPGERTDLAVYHDDGRWTGSPNAKQARPALSLVKLYLGYWILREGDTADKGKVLRMVRGSSDGLAVELDRKYPEAINEIAEEFELTGTVSTGYWGKSSTSPYDLARFISLIKDDPVAEPIIRAMANHAPYAEDGFKQDFGTDQMDGVIGSKFGWSDDRSGAFGSVSFGPDWVIAAMTYGDVDDHTDDVHEWIDQSPSSGLLFPADDGGAREMKYWLSERGKPQPRPTVAAVVEAKRS